MADEMRIKLRNVEIALDKEMKAEEKRKIIDETIKSAFHDLAEVMAENVIIRETIAEELDARFPLIEERIRKNISRRMNRKLEKLYPQEWRTE